MSGSCENQNYFATFYSIVLYAASCKIISISTQIVYSSKTFFQVTLVGKVMKKSSCAKYCEHFFNNSKIQICIEFFSDTFDFHLKFVTRARLKTKTVSISITFRYKCRKVELFSTVIFGVGKVNSFKSKLGKLLAHYIILPDFHKKKNKWTMDSLNFSSC